MPANPRPVESDSAHSKTPQAPGVASAMDRLHSLPQYLLPQRLVTRGVHYITRVRTPWIKNQLIRVFIRYFQVNMSEAAEPDARSYANFNAFFTRRLQPGARPIADGEHTVCCPVDGTVSQIGRIHGYTIFQAKGRYFSLRQLLGDDESRALAFRNGDYTTLYLSPKDYHRIHMPVRGQLREMVHIPGRLFSVSPVSTRVIPNLFARNERVVTLFETDLGPLAMVLVGALNVASIETVWAGPITPPLGTQIRAWRYPQSGPGAISLEKGMEMGRFNMGSTVIVLFGRQAVQWNPGVRPNVPVRMGARLGVRCY